MSFHREPQFNPFGRSGPSPKQRSLLSDIRRPADTFRLKSVVGDAGDNRPDDVAKTELLLGGLGYQDLRRTNGPSGNLSLALDDGIRRFQRDNRLKEDGRIGPDGETITAIRRQVAEADTQPAKPENDSPDPPNDERTWWEKIFIWITSQFPPNTDTRDGPASSGPRG